MILISLLCVTSAAQGQAPETMLAADSLKAEVVYVKGERAYISRGQSDGLASGWRLARIMGVDGEAEIPLVWIGDDLSRIELRDDSEWRLAEGDSVLLIEYVLPDDLSGGSAVRIGAYGRPTGFDRPPVSMFDWDLREAIFARVGPFIDSLVCEETSATTWLLKPDVDRHLSDGRRIDALMICDAIKSNSLRCGPFSILCEFFNRAFDTLYCVAANPFRIQSNFPCLCEESRVLYNSPGFWVCPDEGSEYAHDDLPVTSGDFAIDHLDDTLTMLVRRNKGRTQFADTVEIRFYKDYDAAKLAFELGEVDMVELAPFDVSRYQDTYYVGVEPVNGAVFMSVNNQKSYMQDNLFAASLQYLLNKNSLCRVPLGGAVEPLNRIPGADEFELSSPYEFDPRKGRRLLRQIDGLPKFLSLVLTDHRDQGLARVAEYVRGVLAREGITLTVYRLSDLDLESDDTVESIASFDLMLSRLFDPTGARTMLLFQGVYHTEFDRPEYNRSLYWSEDMHGALVEYLGGCIGNSDEGRGAEKDMIYEHLNVPTGVWLYTPKRFFAMSARVTSLSFLEGGILDLGRIEIDSR